MMLVPGWTIPPETNPWVPGLQDNLPRADSHFSSFIACPFTVFGKMSLASLSKMSSLLILLLHLLLLLLLGTWAGAWSGTSAVIAFCFLFAMRSFRSVIKVYSGPASRLPSPAAPSSGRFGQPQQLLQPLNVEGSSVLRFPLPVSKSRRAPLASGKCSSYKLVQVPKEVFNRCPGPPRPRYARPLRAGHRGHRAGPLGSSSRCWSCPHAVRDDTRWPGSSHRICCWWMIIVDVVVVFVAVLAVLTGQQGL